MKSAAPLFLFFVSSGLVGCSSAPLVPAEAWPHQVATGYAFTEGPAAWDAAFYFTDIPNNRILRHHTLTETTEVFRENSGGANGLMFDEQGRLYMCEGGNRRVTRLDLQTGDLTVITDSFEGKRLNSPNDLVLDRHEGLYFTDPRYGSRENMEMEVEGVYYVDRHGAVHAVITDLTRPNGIALSPDGKTLYVADNAEKTLWAYDVKGPGRLSGARVFAWLDPNGAGGGDGLTVDRSGRVYCAGQGQVWVWDRSGMLLERIRIPEAPSNVAFSGRDSGELYITARTSLYRMRLNARGVR